MTEQVNISGPVNKRWRIKGVASLDYNGGLCNDFTLQKSVRLFGIHLYWTNQASKNSIQGCQDELQKILHKPITTIYQIKEV